MKHLCYINVLLALLFAFMLSACEKEPDKFSVQKLELRQEIDESILRIDQTLEELHAEPMAMEAEEDSVKAEIAHLEQLRSELHQKLEQIDPVTQKGWPSFKNEVDELLKEVDLSIGKIKLDDVDIPQPYPATTRIK